jgi:hypothetical protein
LKPIVACLGNFRARLLSSVFIDHFNEYS